MNCKPIFAITNALIHVLAFIILKFTYNPGLLVSLILNIPLGFYTIMVLKDTNNLSNFYLGVAILFAIIAHMLIAVPMRLRAKTYQTTLS